MMLLAEQMNNNRRLLYPPKACDAKGIRTCERPSCPCGKRVR